MYLATLLQKLQALLNLIGVGMKAAIRIHPEGCLHLSHQIRDSMLSIRVLNTHIPRDYITTKITLANYDGLTDHQEHVQNIRNTMELVIQDSHVICKILPTTFRGSIKAWYNSIEQGSIISFNDLCIKLMARFSTSILARKSTIKLFRIT